MEDPNSIPTQYLVEAYRQAHETRRKWENYIWQWNILLTILAALSVQFSQSLPDKFSLPQKVIASLMTLFVFAMFLNVYRARVLMKEIEKSISDIHKQMRMTSPIVPLELDRDLPRYKKISSTRMATYCHLVAVFVFLGITIYAWVR